VRVTPNETPGAADSPSKTIFNFRAGECALETWIRDVLGEFGGLLQRRVTVRPRHLCIYCRGGQSLCGKPVCPLILKVRLYAKALPRDLGERVEGSSPPAIFVGRYGYPKVLVGPMVPPFHGDTSLMDFPELWLGEAFEKIVEYRCSLMRGKVVANVKDSARGAGLAPKLQELSLSEGSVDVEMVFSKKPAGFLVVDDVSQPFGPSAPLKSFSIPSSPKTDRRIEKAHYDFDLLAGDAVCLLYEGGVPVSRIHRAFSVGTFGNLQRRRLVPTRWSITAVDSIISQKLIEEVKEMECVDKHAVYWRAYMGNLFVGLLIPSRWSFEWIEAWFPRTFWNPSAEVAIEGDYEGYFGRTEYPEIGGCYYASRLAVAEFLKSIRRQATALLFREIYPSFPLPLGVWFVRENVRAMFRGKPLLFEDTPRALGFISSMIRTPARELVVKSVILRNELYQRRISEF